MKSQKNLLILMWSLFFTFVAKESITKLLFVGKGFIGRSFYYQMILFALYLFLFISIGFVSIKLISFFFSRVPLNHIFKKRFEVFFKGNILLHPLIHLVTIFWLSILSIVPRGFDITDNGYYLLITKRFEDVSYEIRLFGLYTRLLYFATGESVARTRLLGAFLLIITVIICGLYICKVLKAKDINQKVLVIVAPLLSTAMFYYDWLSTPSYNWLALISGVCFLIGIMNYIDNPENNSLVSGIVMGGSCFITFFAKPTSALVLFLLSIIVIAIEQKNKERLFQSFLGEGLGAISGVLFLYLNGYTIANVAEKIFKGYQVISLFEHSIPSIFHPLFQYLHQITLSLGSYWIVIVLIFVIFKFGFKRKNEIIMTLGNKLLVSVWLLSLFVSGINLKPGIWAGFSYLLTLLFIFIINKTTFSFEQNRFSKMPKTILWSLYIIVIAFAITFGTINSYSYYFAHILCIFTFATIILLDMIPVDVKSFIHKGFIILLFLLVPYNMFYSAHINPSPYPFAYRQDVETWEMDTLVPIRLGKEQIMVSSNYAEAIENLQAEAVANGFTAETPIIDLSGISPGVVYILDGRSPVYPWFAGGYPNSTKFVQAILNDWNEKDLHESWIITAQISRQIPTSVLSERGLNFPGSYQEVITTVFPFTVDGSNYKFILWKPLTN